MDEALVTSASTSMAQLVERPRRYLFRFNKIVEELQEEKNKLTSLRSRVQEDVNEAKGHAQIENNALDWLREADNLLNDVQILEDRIEENKRSFCWSPNWIRQYQLSKTKEEKTLAIRQLVTSSVFRITQFLESKSSNKAFNEIMEALKDDTVNMIGVWGMAGVGKTTLVAEVVNKVKEVHLFRKVITVVVSQLSDNIGEIQDQIADCLDLKFQESTPQEVKAKELFLRLEKEGKVLMIFDDMWNELDLKKIFDKDPKDYCKIILTTRRRSVCESMANRVIVTVDVLDEEEAWSLFKMNASLDNASEEIINFTKIFMQRYGGLPLVIVRSAGALRSKDDFDGSREEDITNALQTEIEKNAYPSLEKSYNLLSSETCKRCFLLCAINLNAFFSIDVEDLVKYAWGLWLHENAGSIEESRSKVCEAINELKDSCLLSEDNQKGLRMHYIVRLVAKWIASKEDNGLVVKPHEDGSENESSKQKLEILLLDKYDHTETKFQDFERMRKLKVLSIKQEDDVVLHKDCFFRLDALSLLTNLLTLQLVGFKRLDGISAIAKQTKLEILSLHCSEFEESIEELGEFENIRVLDIRECEFLSRFPPNVIPRLHKLEELCLLFGVRLVDSETNISTAILLELNSLLVLKSLSLEVPFLDSSKDFAFPRVERYRISINKGFETNPMTISSRFLAISGRFPLNVISELLWSVEFLQVSFMENDIQCLTDTVAGNVPITTILQNLKAVEIEACENLQVIFQIKEKINQSPLLLNLENLCLSWLPALECIWKMPVQCINLRSLKAVKIDNCPKLKSPFSFSVARSLECLEELEISSCQELREIFTKSDGDEQEISPNIMDSENHSLCLLKLRSMKVCKCEILENIFPEFMSPQGLPQLQKLSLKSLDCLKYIWAPARRCEENDVQPQLPSLTELEVAECPNLTDATNRHLEHRRPTLKHVSLSRVTTRLFEEKIQPQGGYLLSGLEKLEFVDLHELRFICKDPSQIVTLQHLSHLTVSRCGKLRTIFSVVVARNLPQLRYLQVESCRELKHVVEDRISSLLMTGQEPVFFPNLEEIVFKNCNKPKSLFPVPTCLPKLKRLRIENAPNLREIFRHDIEGNMTYDLEMNRTLLPKLESLKLANLPNLIRFTTVSYCFAFPALLFSSVNGCPTMRFTIVDDDSESRYVRAEIEKPKSYDVHGSVTTENKQPVHDCRINSGENRTLSFIGKKIWSKSFQANGSILP